VISILPLLSVIFAALVGLPILWWPCRNGIPQFECLDPQGRTTTRWAAPESVDVLPGQKRYKHTGQPILYLVQRQPLKRVLTLWFHGAFYCAVTRPEESATDAG